MDPNCPSILRQGLQLREAEDSLYWPTGMSLGAFHHRCRCGLGALGLTSHAEVHGSSMPSPNSARCCRLAGLARSIALLEVRLPLGADSLVCHRPLHSWQEPLSAPSVFARSAARLGVLLKSPGPVVFAATQAAFPRDVLLAWCSCSKLRSK